uniref:Putative secreted protein n=1 Tax=Anopheles marajoara TaxID=58244 RepID=A0A2M4CBU6_9DIPT
MMPLHFSTTLGSTAVHRVCCVFTCSIRLLLARSNTNGLPSPRNTRTYSRNWRLSRCCCSHTLAPRSLFTAPAVVVSACV